MPTEYAAESIHNPRVSQLLQQLAREEHTVQQNSGPHGDREARRDAEHAAETIRQKLLQDADPTVLYQYLKTTEIANADAFRTTWQNKSVKVDVWSQLPSGYDKEFFKGWLKPVLPDLEEFPVGSFILNIPFRLRKPYLSKNDRDFYIIDNPIQRDPNLLFPMVRSTGWKGALRGAFWQLGFPETDPEILRMFGSPRAEEEAFNAGRLQFYSSFFTITGLEIINPHDRETKTGKNPILIETVSQDATSNFSIFYFPFDRIGEHPGETTHQALSHLVLVSRGIQAMFTVYGFGAKTSSGFGNAFDTMPPNQPGKVAIKLQLNAGDQTIIDLDFTSLTLLVRKAEALARRLEVSQEKPA